MARAPHPPLVVVQALFADLAARGQVVLGGSALLYALGLVESVGDWDLVTDVRADQVAKVLAARGLAAERHSGDSPQFATAALFRVDAGDHQIDVLVDFAIRSDGGEGPTSAVPSGEVVPIPARGWRPWNQMVLGRPEDWELAYRLMGRTEKAALLRDWLRNEGRPPGAHGRPIRG